MPFDLKNKKVTVIGAAKSGIAVANAVLKLGGVAKISESKALDQSSANLGELTEPARVSIESGGHTRNFIRDSDYVVLSPGVRPDAPAVKWAQEAQIEVMGE